MRKLPRRRTPFSTPIMPNQDEATLLERVLFDTKNMDTTNFTPEQLRQHQKLVEDTARLLQDVKQHN